MRRCRLSPDLLPLLVRKRTWLEGSADDRKQSRAINHERAVTSAFRPKPTWLAVRGTGANSHQATFAAPIESSTPTLFDQLVGTKEDRLRERDAERISGLEVHDQLDLAGLLDRQVGGFCALQNSTYEKSRLAKQRK